MVVVGSWAKGLRDGQGGPHQTNHKPESFNSIGLGARALHFFFCWTIQQERTT